jgi:hypothetical protein
MNDLRKWVWDFRSWCRQRGLSPRYVTKEACQNSRLAEVMEREADKHSRNIRDLEIWMRRWDEANAEKLSREAAVRPHLDQASGQ